jgi:hypothetical protein
LIYDGFYISKHILLDPYIVNFTCDDFSHVYVQFINYSIALNYYNVISNSSDFQNCSVDFQGVTK